MTPTDEVLAEFVAELLKCQKHSKAIGRMWFVRLHDLGDSFAFDSASVFCEKEIASHLIRHLIEEEMKKRGYKVSMSPQDRKYGHFYTIRKYSICVAGPYNPSKTKAVALAAFRAGER